MPDSVYKVIELVGTSTELWEKAAKAAVDRAAKSLRDLRVAEVVAAGHGAEGRKGRSLPGQGEGVVQVRGQSLTCGVAPRHLSGHAQTSSSSKASGETDVTRLFIAMLILGLAGCTSTSSLFTSNEPPPPPPAPERKCRAAAIARRAASRTPRSDDTGGECRRAPAARRRASCWSA